MGSCSDCGRTHYGLCKDYSVIVLALPALSACEIRFLSEQGSQRVSEGHEKWCGLRVSLCSWVVVSIINFCHLLGITLQTYNSATLPLLEIKVSSLTTCWAHSDEVQANCFQEQGPVSHDMPPIPLRIVLKILAKGAAGVWGVRKHWQSSTANVNRQHESLGWGGWGQHWAEEMSGWWKRAASPVQTSQAKPFWLCFLGNEEPLPKQSGLWWNSEIEISQPG